MRHVYNNVSILFVHVKPAVQVNVDAVTYFRLFTVGSHRSPAARRRNNNCLPIFRVQSNRII